MEDLAKKPSSSQIRSGIKLGVVISLRSHDDPGSHCCHARLARTLRRVEANLLVCGDRKGPHEYPLKEAELFKGPALVYNPYYWNPWNKIFWAWHPGWLIVWVQVATFAAIVALVIAAYHTRKPIDFLAPFTFLAA